jgi:methionyl-tRNA formyltransferase
MPQGALKIHETRIAMDQNSEAHKPGEIIAHHPDGPVVSCLDGEAVVITKIQRPGKRAVSGAEFLRGTAMPLGTMLGDL